MVARHKGMANAWTHHLCLAEQRDMNICADLRLCVSSVLEEGKILGEVVGG